MTTPPRTGPEGVPSRALRYAPHAVVASVGYTMFGYAGVPAFYLDALGIEYAAFGLLMSATLLPFVLVQPLAGRLVGRYTTTRLLLWATAVHLVLAVALDLVPTYGALLAVRFLWGSAAGLLVSVGATHIARLYSGGAASSQQGIYGGMITLGGAVGFLTAPEFVAATRGIGVQLGGALLAVPALTVLYRDRGDRSTAPADSSAAAGGSVGSTVTDRTVLLASLFYVAVIGSYITLSTFVTAYFADLGIVGPLNAAVLATATVGRSLGGTVVRYWPVGDAGVVAAATAVAVAGFAGLAFGPPGLALAVLPVVVMLAVSVPFGAVYNVAAEATEREGVALATVIAVGNFAALVLPAVTGAVRDATGDYGGAFLLLGLLNALACAGAGLLVLDRRRGA